MDDGYKDRLVHEWMNGNPPEPDPRYLTGPKKQSTASTFSWLSSVAVRFLPEVGVSRAQHRLAVWIIVTGGL